MDETGIYLQQLRDMNIPRYSRAEEMDLAVAKERGDKQARELLVCSCLPLVVNLAKRWFSFSRLRPTDLIQEGNWGLILAVDRFQPWIKHARLTTYATFWIEQRLRRYLRSEQGNVIHVPYDVASGRREPPGSLAKLTTAKLLKHHGPMSMDAPIPSLTGDPEANVLGDVLPDNREPTEAQQDIQEVYDRDLTRLFSLIDKLDDRERFIMLQRMIPGETLSRVGAALGISRERVRQLEVTAKKKLKAFYREEFWNSNGSRTMENQRNQNEPGDPLTVLDRISLSQVQAEIVKNDNELQTAKARHKKRAGYLRKLQNIVAAREGILPIRGGGRNKSREADPRTSSNIVARFLQGKEPIGQEIIISGTGLSKMQVSSSLRRNTSRFKKDSQGRWSLTNG